MKITDALKNVKQLFLDTAPVIYHVEGNVAYQPLTDFIFQEIQHGVLEGVTSSVTLAECLVHPYRHGDMMLVQQFRNVITAGVHTRYVGVDAVAEPAAELRARYNLTLTDAFQIAAALAAGCDAFLTNDNALKRVSELTILVLDELEL
ncbi:PIN domain-containing protein [Candidatus Poribacteria bacterium]|nr:PIN domain-containing protein [Candidatus Poribacteria bacterium]